MARLLPLPSAVLLLLLPLPLLAATIHVPSQEPTIQAGLNAAGAGDTVLVGCGTYYEHDIDMKSGVCVAGETGDPGCVVIDAQYLGRVFSCIGVGETTAIEGLTNSSGSIADVTFSGNTAGSEGGGLYCYRCSPDATDVVFEGNHAGKDGGGDVLLLLRQPRSGERPLCRELGESPLWRSAHEDLRERQPHEWDILAEHGCGARRRGG